MQIKVTDEHGNQYLVNKAQLIRRPQSGDVYKSPSYAPIIIVNIKYSNDEWILLGRNGLNVYSNSPFNNEDGPITTEKLLNILHINQYTFSHNINAEVEKLLHNK